MKELELLEKAEWLDGSIKERIRSWLKGGFDHATKRQIVEMLEYNPQDLIDSFYTDLAFGTGGLRGIMGVGSNRMNVYTVRGATKGLSNYLCKQFKQESIRVVIGYDSRHNSYLFAQESAKVLAASGIKALLFQELRPTPLISFACRLRNCHAAIMITASHNPPQYNGYKVYWEGGGQVLPPHDQGIMNEVSLIHDLSAIPFVQSLADSMIEWIGHEVDTAYLTEIRKLQLHSSLCREKGKYLRVLYSNLHGTGITLLPRALHQCGFEHVLCVESQKVPDGSFPTTPYPNPEEKQALSLGIKGLMSRYMDIFMATDPDADRLGVVVRHGKEPVILTGNQVACIAVDHVCKALKAKGKLSYRSMFVKSIVTSELFREIVEGHGASCVDVLIGFKYIAQKIDEWEKGSDGLHFVFGGEESLGYLLGSHSRDKDAVVSACLIAEAACLAKSLGYTLVDVLHDIYSRHGVFEEQQISIAFPETREGRTAMNVTMQRLRQKPPAKIIGLDIAKVSDYKTGLGKNYNGDSFDIALPKTDMLCYQLQEGSQIIIRPSGTEPKIKVYIMTKKSIPEIEDIEIRRSEVQRAIGELHNKTKQLSLEVKKLLAFSPMPN